MDREHQTQQLQCTPPQGGKYWIMTSLFIELVGWIIVFILVFSTFAYSVWGQEEGNYRTPKSYESLIKQSLKEGRPLVVGVGCIPAVPTGCLSYKGSADKNGMFAVVPVAGAAYYTPLLSPEASVVGVKGAIENLKKAVSSMTIPLALDKNRQSSQVIQGVFTRQSRSC